MADEQTYHVELTIDERAVLLGMMRSPQISVPTQLAGIIVSLQEKLMTAGGGEEIAPLTIEGE